MTSIICPSTSPNTILGRRLEVKKGTRSGPVSGKEKNFKGNEGIDKRRRAVGQREDTRDHEEGPENRKSFTPDFLQESTHFPFVFRRNSGEGTKETPNNNN